MKQAARSERSRAQILAAALRLFSSQGYRGTNMREIAEADLERDIADAFVPKART